MSTAAIPGFNAKIFSSSDGGSTFQQIAEMTDATLNVEKDPIEVTSFDSAGWREFIDGLKVWSLSGEANFKSNDQSQTDLYNALVDGTTVKIRVRPKQLSGEPEWEGTGEVINFSVEMALDSAVNVPLEIQGTGALTRANQV